MDFSFITIVKFTLGIVVFLLFARWVSVFRYKKEKEIDDLETKIMWLLYKADYAIEKAILPIYSICDDLGVGILIQKLSEKSLTEQPYLWGKLSDTLMKILDNKDTQKKGLMLITILKTEVHRASHIFYGDNVHEKLLHYKVFLDKLLCLLEEVIAFNKAKTIETKKLEKDN